MALILVADDQRPIRRLVRRALEAEGHTVLEATNGRRVIDLLSGEAPCDLLVLDLHMPGVSGTDTLKLLRTERPDLAVIVITGFISEDSAQAAELMSQHGVACLLSKPFRIQRLIQAVDNTLART